MFVSLTFPRCRSTLLHISIVDDYGILLRSMRSVSYIGTITHVHRHRHTVIAALPCCTMPTSQELEWGGGLKQRDNSEAAKEEFKRIAAQPFARYEPDEKYMKELMPGKRNCLGVT